MKPVSDGGLDSEALSAQRDNVGLIAEREPDRTSGFAALAASDAPRRRRRGRSDREEFVPVSDQERAALRALGRAEAEADYMHRSFWSQVDRSAGPMACWPWTGTRVPKGYGIFGENPRTTAHRFSCAEAHGAPPPGKEMAIHSCDNPPCCNPLHLRWGDGVDNAADSVAHGGRSTATWKQKQDENLLMWAARRLERRLERIARAGGAK